MLVIDKSLLRCKDNQSNLYVHPIGLGLFSGNNVLLHNTVIVEFVGTYINEDQRLQRVAANLDKYIIQIKMNEFYLDCHDLAKSFICFASYGNCPMNYINSVTGL